MIFLKSCFYLVDCMQTEGLMRNPFSAHQGYAWMMFFVFREYLRLSELWPWCNSSTAAVFLTELTMDLIYSFLKEKLRFFLNKLVCIPNSSPRIYAPQRFCLIDIWYCLHSVNVRADKTGGASAGHRMSVLKVGKEAGFSGLLFKRTSFPRGGVICHRV